MEDSYIWIVNINFLIGAIQISRQYNRLLFLQFLRQKDKVKSEMRKRCNARHKDFQPPNISSNSSELASSGSILKGSDFRWREMQTLSILSISEVFQISYLNMSAQSRVPLLCPIGLHNQFSYNVRQKFRCPKSEPWKIPGNPNTKGHHSQELNEWFSSMEG